MSTSKKADAGTSKKPPAYDADFRSRFGVNVSPRLAEAIRCHACNGYLYPLRKEVWACEKVLCGKLVPKHVIIERMIAIEPGLRGDCLRDLLKTVAAAKRE